MSASATSVFVFGIYLLVVGTGFLLVPNMVLPMFKFPKTTEPWIRVLGLVVIVLGFYYLVGSYHELSPFLWATVIGRFAVFAGFFLLVAAKKAQPMLVLFGVIDAAGAVWTLLTLQ